MNLDTVWLAVVDYDCPAYIGVFSNKEKAKEAALAYVRGYYGETYTEEMEFCCNDCVGDCSIDDYLKIYLEEVTSFLKG